jgi:hypothetical protein
MREPQVRSFSAWMFRSQRRLLRGHGERSREKVDDAVLVEAAMLLNSEYETRTPMSLGTRSRLGGQLECH